MYAPVCVRLSTPAKQRRSVKIAAQAPQGSGTMYPCTLSSHVEAHPRGTSSDQVRHRSTKSPLTVPFIDGCHIWFRASDIQPFTVLVPTALAGIHHERQVWRRRFITRLGSPL